MTHHNKRVCIGWILQNWLLISHGWYSNVLSVNMLLTNIIIYFIWLRFHCVTLRRQVWSPPYTTASIQSGDMQTHKHTWTECRRMLTGFLTSLYIRRNTLVSRGSALLIPWSRVVGKCSPASRPLILMCSAFSIWLPLYSTASVITPAAWDKP